MQHVECLVSAEQGLKYPSGVVYAQEENCLYICDMGNGRVMRYDFESHKLEKLKTYKNGTHPVKPLAITYLGKNNILLADATLNSIFSYKNGIWKEMQLRAYSFPLIGSIAATDERRIFVTDFLRNRICEVSGNQQVSVLDVPCHKPYGVFLLKDNLYITDTANQCVKIYNTISGTIHSILQGICAPIAITVSHEGMIYFSESRKLYCFNPHTGQIRVLINPVLWKQTGMHKLYHIGAITLAGSHQIVLTDTIQNEIYIIDR